MFKESKPGVQTSEFKAFIAAVIAVVVPLVAGLKLDTPTDRWKAGLIVGGITVTSVAYIVSRGLAKQGAPFDDTGDVPMNGTVDGAKLEQLDRPDSSQTPAPPEGG